MAWRWRTAAGWAHSNGVDFRNVHLLCCNWARKRATKPTRATQTARRLTTATGRCSYHSMYAQFSAKIIPTKLQRRCSRFGHAGGEWFSCRCRKTREKTKKNTVKEEKRTTRFGKGGGCRVVRRGGQRCKPPAIANDIDCGWRRRGIWIALRPNNSYFLKFH